MDFDLLIKGGEVVDPGSSLLGQLDVGIRGGTIAAVDRALPTDQARAVIDAAGLVVTPGLIDLHTHVFWGATYWGIEPDPIAARTGITTMVDAGSVGGYNFPAFRRYVVAASQTRLFSILNLSCIGLTAPTYEMSNLDYLDLGLARQTIEANRDIVVGIKARMDRNVTRGVGLEPLRLARKLADQTDLPIMVHIGAGPPPLEDIFTLLRPGDILTHCFTGNDQRILGPDGKVFDYVRRAHDEGLILDIGHGSGALAFEVAEAALAQGIKPDVISTDTHQSSVQGPMFDLPTTLAKFLSLGMSLPDVIERTTAAPARVLRRPDLGTLKPGAPADVALFRVEEREQTLYDVYMNPRTGKVRLVNTATIRAGVVEERKPEQPPMFWAKLPERQRQVLQGANG